MWAARRILGALVPECGYYFVNIFFFFGYVSDLTFSFRLYSCVLERALLLISNVHIMFLINIAYDHSANMKN